MSTRRNFILGGVAVAGLAAIPAGQHFAWSTRNYVRSGYSPDFPDVVDGQESWQNWSELLKATPRSIYAPATEAELSEFVSSGRDRIRPVGSGHSFSSLVPTDGHMVDVSRLSGLIAFDEATGHARFGAGTRLYDVAVELAGRGRALPNLPDIDVQTLAGSFATGTHGTGKSIPALHDSVIAYRMVLANGEALTVNSDTSPELLCAGQVSLGSLGIMTEFTLKTVPAFNLRRRVSAVPIADLLDQMQSLAEAHRNFEFFYLPGTGLAAQVIHDVHEGPLNPRPPEASGDDDEVLAGLKQLRDQFGWWPWLRRRIAQAALPAGELEDVSDESWKLLATTRPVKFNEMEYHLPAEGGVNVLKEVIEMMDRRKDAFFPMEVRYVAGDTAMLSPFNDGPRLSIAIHAAVDEPFEYFYSDFEPLYRQSGGRPHWGKLHSLTHDACRSIYGEFDRFCEIRRDLDPDGRFLNAHTASLFREPFDA